MIKEKALVQGAYGDGNIGDDLLLDMVIELLLAKGFNRKNIAVTGRRSSYMSKKFEGINVMGPIRGRYIQTDYLILGGGTQFFSFSHKPVRKNKIKIYLNILSQDPGIIFEILRNKIGKKNKINKIALGIGLGPFHNDFSENKVKVKLNSFDEIWCRDKRSMAYCEKWGITAQLTADICLSNLFQEKYFYKHLLSEETRKIIGIVLRDWTQNENGNSINKKILDFIPKCENYIVKIFIFSKFKDAELVSLIRESNLVNNENIHVWDPDTDNFQNYLETINLCDIIITSRYHAAIFALNFNIPTICLAIDPKLKHITQEVNGFSYCEIEEIDNVSKSVTEIFLHYDQIQKNIAASYCVLNNRANKILTIMPEL